MKQVLNGFQCDICNTVYNNEVDAGKCELTTLEDSLLRIGDIIIDDSYDTESEMRVCRIYYSGHEVNYRMEWQAPDGDGEWTEVYSIYGNEMLIHNYDVNK